MLAQLDPNFGRMFIGLVPLGIVSDGTNRQPRWH